MSIYGHPAKGHIYYKGATVFRRYRTRGWLRFGTSRQLRSHLEGLAPNLRLACEPTYPRDEPAVWVISGVARRSLNPNADQAQSLVWYPGVSRTALTETTSGYDLLLPRPGQNRKYVLPGMVACLRYQLPSSSSSSLFHPSLTSLPIPLPRALSPATATKLFKSSS